LPKPVPGVLGPKKTFSECGQDVPSLHSGVGG
jgi:hypothetical protein